MPESRRTFLKMSAAAAPAAAAVKSPNDRIHLGLIGAGGRGSFHISDLNRAKSENFDIVHICDVHRPALDAAAARAAKSFGATPKKSADYRELLANPEVDAVIIAAPDFTHAQILEHAVEAGKDAYAEKPFGTNFYEAKKAWLAVKRTGRIVQVGTQRRSDPALMAAAKLMQAGTIGKVTRVDMEVHFQEPRWRRKFEDIREQDLDWQLFLFGRNQRPFDARRFRQWQLFHDYTNGIPGLWMSHFIDLVPWYLNQPYPSSAAASGGVYLWNDGRETEDVFRAMLEYPGGTLVTFAMSLTNDAGARNLWFGTKGTMDLDAMRITGAGSKQPDRVATEIAIAPETTDTHMVNFLKCLRTRKAPRATVDAGFSHAVAGCMSAEAFRTGRKVRFDPVQLEIV